MKLTVHNRQLIVRQFEIPFQPFQESGFKYSATTAERVARHPDQFGFSKVEFPDVRLLVDNFRNAKEAGETHPRRAAEKREGDVGFREMLPDKLQHQQLVEIGIEQRPGNRVQFPVMVVRPLSEVDNHRRSSLAAESLGRVSNSELHSPLLVSVIKTKEQRLL